MDNFGKAEPRPVYFRFRSNEEFERISAHVDDMFELLYEAEGWEMEKQTKHEVEKGYHEIKIKAWENREKKRKAQQEPPQVKKLPTWLLGLTLWLKRDKRA